MTVEKIVPSGATIHYLRGNFPTSSARNAHNEDDPCDDQSDYLGRNRFAGCDSPFSGHSQLQKVVMASVVPMSGPLRLALLADATASGATAALLVAGAKLLEDWLGLPVALMREAGMVLIPFVMVVAFIASRPAAPVSAVNAIIGINAASDYRLRMAETPPEGGAVLF
jgi:hypothetical protein